ncbi:MAG TPA: Arc family DNA-binding protein [Xanthobacteraceae bacterium]|nr:Arc family DNA-binding protein [Xanthobacteraceae bacterium]
MSDAVKKKTAMAQLVVRNLEPGVKTRLQKRARKHGHSMEEEVRAILRDAVKREDRPSEGLGTRIANRFRGIGLKEPIPELRGEVWARPVDFSGEEFDPKKRRR